MSIRKAQIVRVTAVVGTSLLYVMLWMGWNAAASGRHAAFPDAAGPLRVGGGQAAVARAQQPKDVPGGGGVEPEQPPAHVRMLAICLTMFAMPIPWRSSPEVFAQILRRHGIDRDAVPDVEAAWRAFGEFLQVAVDGIDPDPDSDADGFIVHWGRYSWNNRRPSLSFTRQLAVADSRGRDDPDWRPEYWQIDLQMCFDDEPDLVGLDSLAIHDTGFSFDPIGPQRTAELAKTRMEMERYPQLRAVWRATPVNCTLSFECVC